VELSPKNTGENIFHTVHYELSMFSQPQHRACVLCVTHAHTQHLCEHNVLKNVTKRVFERGTWTSTGEKQHFPIMCAKNTRKHTLTNMMLHLHTQLVFVRVACINYNISGVDVIIGVRMCACQQGGPHQVNLKGGPKISLIVACYA